jgi:hypothetical protein
MRADDVGSIGGQGIKKNGEETIVMGDTLS